MLFQLYTQKPQDLLDARGRREFDSISVVVSSLCDNLCAVENPLWRGNDDQTASSGLLLAVLATRNAAKMYLAMLVGLNNLESTFSAHLTFHERLQLFSTAFRMELQLKVLQRICYQSTGLFNNSQTMEIIQRALDILAKVSCIRDALSGLI